jgi:hypothetical protein
MEHPEIIYNVSQSQLSIARHYGGITYNGVEYVYNPADDTLTKKPRPEKKAKKPLQPSWL